MSECNHKVLLILRRNSGWRPDWWVTRPDWAGDGDWRLGEVSSPVQPVSRPPLTGWAPVSLEGPGQSSEVL